MMGSLMLIAFRSRIVLNHMFAIAKWSIGSMTVALLIYFAISMFRAKSIEAVAPTIQSVAAVDVEKMLTGPLGLYENKRSALALALEQNLILLVQNVRPDLGLGERIFSIGFKGSEEQRVIKENESIQFTWNEEKVELVPHLIKGDRVLLKLGEEELFLQENPKGMDNFDQFQAKWWGSDLFFREYGGAEYRELGEKYKVELTDGNVRYFVYVQPHDTLTLKEGRWSVGEADRSAPLAVVNEVSDSELEMEAWDESGASLFQTKVPLQKHQPIRFAPDQVIADPKLRSGSQVSCKIGKKRVVLKPNDWVIKTQTGWRKLITINEIESYLNNELLEELFVVDSIEQGGQIRGRHFDALRTQMKPFTIQAASAKVKSTKKRTSTAK